MISRWEEGVLGESRPLENRLGRLQHEKAKDGEGKGLLRKLWLRRIMIMNQGRLYVKRVASWPSFITKGNGLAVVSCTCKQAEGGGNRDPKGQFAGTGGKDNIFAWVQRGEIDQLTR